MDTKPENKFAQAFRNMADLIDRNLESDFAGAMLVVPPEGDHIAVMMADPSKDMESFLSMCVAKVQIRTAEYSSAKRGPGFGR